MSLDSLRKQASGYPEVEESVACKGTVIQSATFKVGGKAFLFLRPARAMLKLGASLPEVMRMAKANTSALRAGSGGWITIPLPAKKPVTAKRLTSWIRESYELFAAPRAARAAPRRGQGRRPQ